MMDAQHTPGPWQAETDDGSLQSFRPWVGRLNEGVYSALSCGINRQEAEANARLIAAAPDLLETLYQYVSDLRYPPQGDSVQRRIERAEAAIARATGKDAS